MEKDLELEGLLFEYEEKQNVYIDEDSLEIDKPLTDRWSAWVNIINR